jgi:uncharacterized protein (TIGR02444 family)
VPRPSAGEADPTENFKRFALELYACDGVSPACLHLQDRFDLDVNLVLFAAYVGAVQRQSMTPAGLEVAKRGVEDWHREVVRSLRAVRRRLKTGPTPAPNDETTRLRRKVQQAEIDAEMIELGQLGAVLPQLNLPAAGGSGVDCATAAIETVVRAYSAATLQPDDRQAIRTVASAAT